ncbi:17469_t:CDS:2, partial [Racocetra persica]
MAKVKDLSDKVETGQEKILDDLNNLTFPEGYAPVYKKFSDLLDEDYLTKIIITSRGTGKSHNVKSSLEPWRKILNKYCFEYTQEKISIRDFEEVWEAITRGIKYKGIMRLHFIELYKSEDARELLDKNVDIFMDEAIPNPKGKDKTNLKYLDDEDILYEELYGSAPFNKYLSENLKEIKEKLWRDKVVRIEVEEENLRGEIEKSLLYLYATEHKRELFEKEWGNFFLSEEALNMIKVPDNYEILYKLQGFLKCRVLRTGKTFFISEANGKIPVPRWTEEICLTNEDYNISNMRNKRLLNRQEIRELVREYLEDINNKFLKFADFENDEYEVKNRYENYCSLDCEKNKDKGNKNMSSRTAEQEQELKDKRAELAKLRLN